MSEDQAERLLEYIKYINMYQADWDGNLDQFLIYLNNINTNIQTLNGLLELFFIVLASVSLLVFFWKFAIKPFL